MEQVFIAFDLHFLCIRQAATDAMHTVSIAVSLLERKSMETLNIINERIMLSLHALNWTMGEFAFFDITLASGGELTVDWGDGHVSHYHPRCGGERFSVEHDYGRKAENGRQHSVVNRVH